MRRSEVSADPEGQQGQTRVQTDPAAQKQKKINELNLNQFPESDETLQDDQLNSPAAFHQVLR